MCIFGGSKTPAPPPLPPPPPEPPKIPDQAVQRARDEQIGRARAAAGFSSTQLSTALGGTKKGSAKTLGSGASGGGGVNS